MKRIILLASMFLAVNAAAQNNNDLRDFKNISLSIPADLVVTLETDFNVKTNIPADLEDKIVIEKENETLKIRWKDKNAGKNYYSKQTAKITVSMPVLQNLSSAGSGDITVNNTNKTDNFSCSLAGSGDVKMAKMVAKTAKYSIAGSGDIKIDDLMATDVQFDIAGSGDIEISNGTTNDVRYNISGSGDITARGLQGKSANCNIAGSGNIDCYASESVQISVVGSGEVTYGGSPKNVTKSGGKKNRNWD